MDCDDILVLPRWHNPEPLRHPSTFASLDAHACTLGRVYIGFPLGRVYTDPLYNIKDMESYKSKRYTYIYDIQVKFIQLQIPSQSSSVHSPNVTKIFK